MPGLLHQNAPQNQGDHPVEPTGFAQGPSQRQGQRNQGDRVTQNLLGRGLVAAHHRQHGHTYAGVVIPNHQSQRPEVRRSPEENNPKQCPGGPIQRARHGGPTHQGRNGPRRAANHDVVGTVAFQPVGIDHHIAANSRHRQQSRQQIGHPGQQPKGRNAQDDREYQSIAGANLPGGNWALLGAHHDRINVAIVKAVDRISGTGSQGPTGQGCQKQHRIHITPASQGHGRCGGNQQQHNDPGLGELNIAPNDRPGSLPGRRSRFLGHVRQVLHNFLHSSYSGNINNQRVLGSFWEVLGNFWGILGEFWARPELFRLSDHRATPATDRARPKP